MTDPVIVLGCLTITVDSYRTNERHHDLAEAVMRRFGYDAIDVCEIRVAEGRIEIDTLDRTPGSDHAITTHVH